MTASLAPSTRNVLRVYRSATPAELDAGRAWFSRARDLAEELDPDDVERAAAVLAVLSPQTSWLLNVRYARLAYALFAEGATVDEITAAVPCYKTNSRKAAVILHGADPDAVVSGPKVRAFWHTIAHPDDARSVVVDRHAIDVAVGHVIPAPVRHRLLDRVGGYAEAADCYLRAARILTRQLGRHVTAAEVQSVTWTVWRRHHAAAFHGDDVPALSLAA